jgi:predicted  nucleic acid-binding Zn-ribbon protein
MTERSDEERRFRIMDGPSLPWCMIEPYEVQALANHDQTLAQLHSRGGLSCAEALAVLEKKPYRQSPEHAYARQRLVELLAAFEAQDQQFRIAELTADLDDARAGWESAAELARELTAERDILLADFMLAQKERDSARAELEQLRGRVEALRAAAVYFQGRCENAWHPDDDQHDDAIELELDLTGKDGNERE